MGMSASQARLLTLTSRLSDLEYQAQSISNSKIRLSDQSAEVSQKYEDALDKKKIQVLNSDTSKYVDASAYNLTTYGAVSELDKQRFICDNSGKILTSQKIATAFQKSTSDTSISKYLQSSIDSSDYYGVAGKTGYSSLSDFLKAMGIPASSSDAGYDAEKLTYYTNLYNGKEDFLNSLGYTSASDALQKSDSNYSSLSNGASYTYDKSAVKYYGNTYDQIDSNGYSIVNDSNLTDSEWLYDQLSGGNIYLSEYSTTGGNNGAGGWNEVSYSSGDSTLETTSDDTGIAKAEADYNTKMAQIQSKDNRYDLELKTIDTEHSAIQTEIDSVKKVIDKNIERSFKVFDA